MMLRKARLRLNGEIILNINIKLMNWFFLLTFVGDDVWFMRPFDWHSLLVFVPVGEGSNSPIDHCFLSSHIASFSLH